MHGFVVTVPLGVHDQSVNKDSTFVAAIKAHKEVSCSVEYEVPTVSVNCVTRMKSEATLNSKFI